MGTTMAVVLMVAVIVAWGFHFHASYRLHRAVEDRCRMEDEVMAMTKWWKNIYVAVLILRSGGSTNLRVTTDDKEIQRILDQEYPGAYIMVETWRSGELVDRHDYAPGEKMVIL